MGNESGGLRVVFLGMACAAAAPPLRSLLDGGFAVRAVALAATGAGGQSPGPRSGVEELARAAAVPLVWAARTAPDLTAAVAAHAPEAVVVACWPWRLPAALLALPPLGCLNVHPSLLPVGRGLEPVFWTLRRGERRTGATVFRMDAGFDTGPILAQAALDVPAGVRAPGLERRLMELGGRLLVDALPKLAAGEITPIPQDEALATHAPTPTAADFAVPTTLPAGWAFNFVRGVAPLGGPLEVLIGATRERLPVRDALDHAPDEAMAAAVAAEGGGVVRVRFKPGWVRFLRR